MNKKAKQILQKTNIDKLPSLPHVLLQLLDACHDKQLSANELTTILKQDPGLFSRAYATGLRNNPVSIHDEAEINIDQILLDSNTVKNIAVTAAVQQFFSRNSIERTDFLKQHWHHSIYCAIVAESIAIESGYSNPDEAYTAGLLHNIGQLILETAYPKKYSSAFAQLSEDEFFHSLEQEEFGTTHQQVGAQLLHDLGTNSFICDAVLYHHENAELIQDAHPLVKITKLANEMTSSYFEEDQTALETVEQLLSLNSDQTLDILERARERLADISHALEISLVVDGMDGEATKQQNTIDEQKQEQLADHVRSIALLDGVHQQLSLNSNKDDNNTTVIDIVSQNIDILFGIGQSIVFLYDETSDRINAVAGNNQPPQIADLSIQLRSGRSLVADALLTQEPVHSFITDSIKHDLNRLSIIDKQLINITQLEGIICIPMIAANTTIGTLVLGVDKEQYDELWKQLTFLKRFTSEIAHCFNAYRKSSGALSEDDQKTGQLEQRIHEVLHEVRNPLSIMNNYLGILSYKLESDKEAQEDVQTIKSEIERVSQILNRLTEAESPTEKIAPADINEIITDLTRVFQTSLFASKNIQISLDLDERIGSLDTNADAIKQIYTNLIKNAVEALPANGELMVYTQDYVNVDGEDHIEISVADNGPGISTDILPRLFSPIESTKGEGHAGLGLTIVKNLVNELHGSISCRSSDNGTGFYILLPKQIKK